MKRGPNAPSSLTPASSPDRYYAMDEEERDALSGQAELIVAKQRNGPVGVVELTFLKEFTRYEDRTETPAA